VGWAKAIPNDPLRNSPPSLWFFLVIPADSTHTLCARRRWRVVNAEESSDASDHTTDRSGDNGTDWPCDAIAFSRAMLEAAGKSTLRLSCDRRRQGCNNNACVQD